jgi:hypothetical protein
MSTLNVTNLAGPSNTGTAATLSSINGGPISGARNRIINGDMRIDQRNGGASGTALGYTVDRFLYSGDQPSKITWQQNAGAVTPPGGFTNYLGFTTTSAHSVASSESFRFEHLVEGFNCADLGWGTGNAQAITLSFWVRSSLTGTFGGTIQNSGRVRSYPFSWTISAANTWEQKSITIGGDTSGTWLTNNGIGIRINFNLGAGAALSGAAGSWSGSNFVSATGATSVVGTNGATFYITGVQLEAGTVSTPFERRSFSHELQLCERYYEKSYNLNAVPGTNVGPNTGEWVSVTINSADYNDFGRCSFRTRKRASTTMSIWSTDGTPNAARQQDASNVPALVRATFNETSGAFGCGSSTPGNYHRIHFAASAEL